MHQSAVKEHACHQRYPIRNAGWRQRLYFVDYLGAKLSLDDRRPFDQNARFPTIFVKLAPESFPRFPQFDLLRARQGLHQEGKCAEPDDRIGNPGKVRGGISSCKGNMDRYFFLGLERVFRRTTRNVCVAVRRAIGF